MPAALQERLQVLSAPDVVDDSLYPSTKTVLPEIATPLRRSPFETGSFATVYPCDQP